MCQSSEGEARWVLEETCGTVVYDGVCALLFNIVHIEGVRIGEEERK